MPRIARVLLALSVLLPWVGFSWSAAQVGQPAKADDPGGPWGKAVDGMVCRLTVQPRCTISQPIPAVYEIKNVSDKQRYIIRLLGPKYIDYGVGIAIEGPKGQVRQGQGSKTLNLDAGQFRPIKPGETVRIEVADLRGTFTDLDPLWISPALKKPNEVPTGTFNARLRFKSPVVPKRFARTLFDPKLKALGETTYIDAPQELLAAHWAGEIESNLVSFELAPLAKDDLVIHEWGVFTVLNDAKYANANRKQEWGSLPTFFYRQFPQERLRWIPSAWDKPIVYVYAKPSPLHLRVKVTFIEGAPVVWWPAASDPVDNWPGPQLIEKSQPFRSLTWDAWIGAVVPISDRTFRTEGLTKTADFPLPADSWLQHARLPSASQLTVIGDDLVKSKGRPGQQIRPETERFLFYDGLVPAPDYIRCEKINDTSLTLRNLAPFDITRLFVVDRRDKGRVGFAYVDGTKQPLRAGTTWNVQPLAIAAAEWPAAGIKAVRQALLDAGLFEPEADSLLKIWHSQFFEAEGVTAFHILPPSEYDRMLALDILPTPPTKPVRVGIALHPHMEIEPGLSERVGVLVRQLDDVKYDKRAAASKALLDIGPIAIGTLRAELRKGPSLEMKRRIEDVLNRVDAEEWMKTPAAGEKNGKK